MCHMSLLVPLILFMSLKLSEAAIAPAGMSMYDATTCEEFGKTARFNPYSVVGMWWFMFYYWDEPRGPEMFYFYVPTRIQAKVLHEVLDGQVTVPINWTAKHVLMANRKNGTSLLVERSDRGEYWLYNIHNDKSKMPKMLPLDFRFKQTGDNELIGIMDCASHSAYVLSKVKKIPRQKDIPEVAARIGYRGRRGRSYLYQGHEWMPIPEMDEMEFWMTPKMKQKYQYRLKNQ